MTLGVSTGFASRLADAAADGMDVVFLAVIYFPEPVGVRYYSTRPVSTLSGFVPEVKLQVTPQVSKRVDGSAARFDALNDEVQIAIRNTYESESGADDSDHMGHSYRFQDLMMSAPLSGALVDLGVADLRSLTTTDDIKWDGRYRVDRIDRDSKLVRLYCVDRMLQPGEKVIGRTVNAGDWPSAPDESFGQIRGPVFGRVDTLPLVPVETGLFAALASEIDAQDVVVDLTGDLSLWPDSGFVEIGDETIYYVAIDRAAGRLGSAASPCLRGAGYPLTPVGTHADGVVVRELYSGRESTVDGGIDGAATEIPLADGSVFPAQGIVLIGDESSYYYARSGNTLTNLWRGIPVPTIAKVHDAGSPVRSFPIGPDGLIRYRYIVGDGEVSGISNVRIIDENGNALPYTGGAVSTSQVTAANGDVWTVADLPARARFERYEASGSDVAQEWIAETNGEMDAEGVATAASFLRWKAGAGMSAEHLATWPRAVDPNASTRAVILEVEAAKNVFALEFDADWDAALNAPRKKYGRFRDARLRVRFQYDRATAVKAQFQVHTNGYLVKSGTFQTPSLGGTVGDGTVGGSQQLPMSRWDTQKQTTEVKVSPRDTPLYADSMQGYWVDPMTVRGSVIGGYVDQVNITSGDTRKFMSGGWLFPVSPGPNYYGGGSLPATRVLVHDEISLKDVLTGRYLGPMRLYSTNSFPESTSFDRLNTLVVTIFNPTGSSDFQDLVWTGWEGFIHLYSGLEFAGTAKTYQVGISSSEGKKTFRILLDGLTWADCQSLEISINQYTGTQGEGSKGATVGQISIAIESTPDVEGQRVGTIVDGSYFSASATTTPSAIYDQTISLGATAKDVARSIGNVDPWEFFRSVLGAEGLRLTVSLPSSGEALRFAVADVFLDLEYDALTVTYDGQVVADVDGRVAVPAGGGAAVLLENPVDVLAHLVDSDEFFGLDGDRDSDSWTAARALAETIGWRVARAVVSSTQLRDLAASLAAESRLYLLADELKIFAKSKFEDAPPAESIRTVGDVDDPALALVSDDLPVANKWEDLYNSIGFYYRRNYRTEDFRAVLEERDDESVRLYRERRTTLDLHWHQSSRGYVGGIEEQKARLKWLTGYTLADAARVWDYATVEVSASGAEDLQRYDVLTVHRPRSGCFSANGRVVSSKRMSGPVRWEIVLKMSGGSTGYVWQSLIDPLTFVRLGEGGTRMDFVVQGGLVATLNSAGNFRCRGGVSFSDLQVNKSRADFAGTHDFADSVDGSTIDFYRVRAEAGSFGDHSEKLFSLDADGNLTVFVYYDLSSFRVRDLAAPGTLAGTGGIAGIVDTGTAGSVTGKLDFLLANRLALVVDDNGLVLRGNLISDLGINLGGLLA